MGLGVLREGTLFVLVVVWRSVLVARAVFLFIYNYRNGLSVITIIKKIIREKEQINLSYNLILDLI
jgi:hypothetical protein